MTGNLAIHDTSTFWAHRRWPEIRAWPDKPRTLIICPVTSFTDWGIGHPLDAEEILVMRLLQRAGECKPKDLSWLVLPPCRFVAGAHERTAFALPLATACRQLTDWGRSMAGAGFTRLVFVNASPFCEDIVDTCGCDLRAEEKLQVFSIHLARLGLDLHPRSPDDRRRAQTIVTALTGQAPIISTESAAPSPEWPQGVSPDWMPPVWPMPEPLSLSEAKATGTQLLEATAAHFVRLALEIRDHPPLA